jgi:hypothetical protein
VLIEQLRMLNLSRKQVLFLIAAMAVVAALTA